MTEERPKRRRTKRRRVRRFNLQKAMFVLPNLFTVSSIFCGFYSIVLSSGNPDSTQLYNAALAIFFGVFFDGADGRVARLTRTQSEFGVQLDSLADLVTFGVAPAVLVHKWALARLGLLGAAVAFAFLAAGAIRLARFNVLAARGAGSSAHFIGLPIPLAAGVLVSLVMFHQRTFAEPATREMNVVALILILAFLMVSNVRYRSFKSVRATRKVMVAVAALIILFSLIASLIRPTFAILSFFCGYALFGMLEEVLFFRKRRAQASPG